MEKDDQDSPGLRAADQNSKGEACRAGGKTQMDECKALTGCHPPVLPYSAVVIQGQFAEGLPFPPLDSHSTPLGALV